MDVVFDIDGTLANCAHRTELARAKQWDAFHEASIFDAVYPDTYKLMGILGTHHNVLCLTGRPEKYRAITMNWLLANSLFPDEIIMRPDDDWTQDGELKVRLLSERYGSLEGALAEVAFILEDRDRVVEALRNAGFNVWQVRQGSY